MKLFKILFMVIVVQWAHAPVNCNTTGDQLGPYFN